MRGRAPSPHRPHPHPRPAPQDPTRPCGKLRAVPNSPWLPMSCAEVGSVGLHSWPHPSPPRRGPCGCRADVFCWEEPEGMGCVSVPVESTAGRAGTRALSPPHRPLIRFHICSLPSDTQIVRAQNIQAPCLCMYTCIHTHRYVWVSHVLQVHAHAHTETDVHTWAHMQTDMPAYTEMYIHTEILIVHSTYTHTDMCIQDTRAHHVFILTCVHTCIHTHSSVQMHHACMPCVCVCVNMRSVCLGSLGLLEQSPMGWAAYEQQGCIPPCSGSWRPELRLPAPWLWLGLSPGSRLLPSPISS